MADYSLLSMEYVVKFNAPTKPPTIEFDPSVWAWYIRFRKGKIAKTISEERAGYVYAIDLDANDEVLGFELLGVKSFSIRRLKEILPMNTSGVDFERAEFIPATRRESVPVCT